MERACLKAVSLLVVVISWLMIVGYPPVAHAETRYVSDLLVISMRAEPENEAEVIRTLRSDTPLEVLEENDTFLKVRLESGAEGWVVKRYTTTNIPKPLIITELGEKINRLEVQLEAAEKKRQAAEQKLAKIEGQQYKSVGALKSRVEKERQEAHRISREYETVKHQYEDLLNKSQNVVQLSKKIKQLEAEGIQLRVTGRKDRETVLALEKKNKELVRAAIVRWFLAGSGVLLIGIILGKMSRKKDYY